MADFEAQLTSGAVVEAWEDADLPRRTNTIAGHPHRRLRVAPNTLVTAEVVIPALGGTVAPLDSSITPYLFVWWWVEYPPGLARPPITPAAGRTSRATFTMVDAGHWCIGVRRDHSGSAFLIHFDVH